MDDRIRMGSATILVAIETRTTRRSREGFIVGRKEELDDLIAAFDPVHDDHSNPARVGCPGRTALTRLASEPEALVGAKHLQRGHLSPDRGGSVPITAKVCSPAFYQSAGQGQEGQLCSSKCLELAQIGAIRGFRFATAVVGGKVSRQKFDSRTPKDHLGEPCILPRNWLAF